MMCSAYWTICLATAQHRTRPARHGTRNGGGTRPMPTGTDLSPSLARTPTKASPDSRRTAVCRLVRMDVVHDRWRWARRDRAALDDLGQYGAHRLDEQHTVAEHRHHDHLVAAGQSEEC